MTGKYIVISVSILMLLSASILLADDFDACKKAISAQVVQKNPKAGNVTFDSSTPITQKNGDIQFTGAGGYERHSGEKESFSWKCTTNKGIVKDASYSVMEGKALSAESVDSCQSSVRDKIHSEQAGSGAVTFVSKDMNDADKVVSGKGHVVVKGKETNFDYKCQFDPKGMLQDKKYEFK